MENPLDQVWLDIEPTFCDKIQIPNLPFISPIIQQHNWFKNINISTLGVIVGASQEVGLH